MEQQSTSIKRCSDENNHDNASTPTTKATYKSKAKEHSACLTRRLLSWEIGDIDSLIREGRAIQSKLQTNRKPQTQEAIAKSFAKLMLSGKVNAAIRLLDKTQPSALLEMNEDTLNDLKEKHPDAKLPDQSVMIEAEAPFGDPIIFNNIDESTISKAALRTKGAAGPSGLDADGWRRILVSKNFGKHGQYLRSSIAQMTRIICTEEIPTQQNLKSYFRKKKS